MSEFAAARAKWEAENYVLQERHAEDLLALALAEVDRLREMSVGTPLLDDDVQWLESLLECLHDHPGHHHPKAERVLERIVEGLRSMAEAGDAP